MKTPLRLSILAVILHSWIQAVQSDKVLRLLPSPTSWSEANSLCKAAGGQLARVNKTDLTTLRDCPGLVEETGSYWSAGYNYLTPWFELLGCYQVPVGSSFMDVKDYDECYQLCKQSNNFGLQEGGKCVCVNSTISLSFTAAQSCLPCPGGSQYSCGRPGYVALYRPYLQDLDNRFCELGKNETCDCGLFQCEENTSWVYFSRKCSSKLQASCSDGNFTDDNLAWVDSRQACINKGSYMSGPNIESWCSASNVSLRIPYWGHLHRDRTTLYADTTTVGDSDISRIRECQYFSVIDDDVKLLSTPSCNQSKGYLCSFDTDHGHQNDCLVRTTTSTTTISTTPPPTTTTTKSPTTTTPTTTTTHPPSTTSTTTTPVSPGNVGAIKDEGLSDEDRTGLIAGIFVGVLILILIVVAICSKRRKKVKEPETTTRVEKGRNYFNEGASIKHHNGNTKIQNNMERQPSSYPYKGTTSFAAPETQSDRHPDENEQPIEAAALTGITNPVYNNEEAVSTMPPVVTYTEDERPPTPCVANVSNDHPLLRNSYYITASHDDPTANTPSVHSIPQRPNDENGSQDMSINDSEFDDDDDDDENDDDTNINIPFRNPEPELEMKVEEPKLQADIEPVTEQEPVDKSEQLTVPPKRPAYVSVIRVIATKTEDTLL